jgi:hypothetical protein
LKIDKCPAAVQEVSALWESSYGLLELATVSDDMYRIESKARVCDGTSCALKADQAERCVPHPANLMAASREKDIRINNQIKLSGMTIVLVSLLKAHHDRSVDASAMNSQKTKQDERE